MLYLSKVKDILNQKVQHFFTGILYFDWLMILKKNFSKLFLKFFYWNLLSVINKRVDFLIENLLMEYLALNWINRVPHFVWNCSIYQLKKFLFSRSDVIHNLRRNIDYLNQKLFFFLSFKRLKFELDVPIFIYLLIVFIFWFARLALN